MDDGFVIGKDAYVDIVFLRFCVRTSSLRNFVGVKMFPGICIRISMKFLAFFFIPGRSRNLWKRKPISIQTIYVKEK